nr:hypothetical protein [Pseudofrankia asymbiotica]
MTIASARSNDQLVETARQGVAVLGPDTPAALRLENIARFLDFISESITRAAEQARQVLHTSPEQPRTAPNNEVQTTVDRGSACGAPPRISLRRAGGAVETPRRTGAGRGR